MWDHVRDTGEIKNREKDFDYRKLTVYKGNKRRNQTTTKQEECSSQRRLGDSKREVSSGREDQLKLHGRGSN